ncbi:sensor histidine kinase [Natrononativus amylolyticus]|uniref:sensor histidine kinase n=1 Tax=Natrononativus amylolyticus TaxID=2963434 RepID=UPI0020CDA816|nr:ATP-binding protein [Natrononativus amylolyticus]
MNGSYRERAAGGSVRALCLTPDETLGGREPAAFESDEFSLSPVADRERMRRDALDADCAVVDGTNDGSIEAVEALLEAHPTLPVIVVGGSVDLEARALEAGVTECLRDETLDRNPGLLEARVRRAVGSARASEASRPRRRGSRSWAAFYGSLYEVSSDADLEFEEKLEHLLSFGSEYLGVELGFLTRIEDGTQTVEVAVGDHELLQNGSQYPLSEAYCRKTIETDGLLGVHDALAAGWEGDPAYEAFDLGCYIGGRVTVDGALYGTLCFADTDPQTEPFTGPERTAVELLTRWVSYELEERHTRERLRRKTERLERLTAVVSHDLRNPLTVAQLQLGLAREAIDADLEALGHVADAHDRMETIIDDLLWLAREGRDVGALEPASLAAVARDAWGTVDTGEATLEVTDREVVADPNRLRQILENLFRNAVDHAGEEPTVRVGPLDGGASGFYVEDDGPGVPAELGERVFEPGTTESDQGTGLGLSIVRGIATAHDWDVSLTRSDAGGARFEFTGVDGA